MRFPLESLSQRQKLFYAALSCITFGVLYTLVVYSPWFPIGLAPRFGRLLPAALQWMSGPLLNDLLRSVLLLFSGLGIALVLSVPLGMVLAFSPKLKAVFSPLISAFRYLPPPALLPLLVIIAGIGSLSKVLIIAIAVSLVAIPGVMDSIQKTPLNLIRVGQTLGFRDTMLVWKVVVPFVLPDLWRVTRASIGIAWTYVILSELISASGGLGFRLVVSQRFLRLDVMVVVLIMIGIIGILCDRMMSILHSRFFPWDVPKEA